MELDQVTDRIQTLRRARPFVERAFALGAGRPFDNTLYQKATVDAMTTQSDGALAAARIGAPFMDAIRDRLLAKLQGFWFPMPLNTFCPLVSSGVVADFVAEGKPTPVALLNLDTVTITYSKLGLILAITKELFRTADPRAVGLFERHLRRAVREGEDIALLSSDAAVPFERPAGLLYGKSSLGSGSPAGIAEDIETLWVSVRDGDPERPVFIVSARGALHLALLKSSDGSAVFPDIRVDGGFIFGVPVVTSPAAQNRLILLDAAWLGVADEGIDIDRADHAAIQMNSTPSPGSAELVSAFQTNTRFVKIIRFVHWVLAYDDAVAYLDLPIAVSPA